MYPIRFHSFINDFNIALEQSKRTSSVTVILCLKLYNEYHVFSKTGFVVQKKANAVN